MPQAAFTKTVERHLFERVDLDPQTGARLAPALTYKVVQLKNAEGPRRAARCWLPRGTEAPDGQTEGEWAAESVAAFELVALRYGRRRGDDGPDGEGGAP